MHRRVDGLRCPCHLVAGHAGLLVHRHIHAALLVKEAVTARGLVAEVQLTATIAAVDIAVAQWHGEDLPPLGVLDKAHGSAVAESAHYNLATLMQSIARVAVWMKNTKGWPQPHGHDHPK